MVHLCLSATEEHKCMAELSTLMKLTGKLSNFASLFVGLINNEAFPHGLHCGPSLLKME